MFKYFTLLFVLALVQCSVIQRKFEFTRNAKQILQGLFKRYETISFEHEVNFGLRGLYDLNKIVKIQIAGTNHLMDDFSTHSQIDKSQGDYEDILTLDSQTLIISIYVDGQQFFRFILYGSQIKISVMTNDIYPMSCKEINIKFKAIDLPQLDGTQKDIVQGLINYIGVDSITRKFVSDRLSLLMDRFIKENQNKIKEIYELIQSYVITVDQIQYIEYLPYIQVKDKELIIGTHNIKNNQKEQLEL